MSLAATADRLQEGSAALAAGAAGHPGLVDRLCELSRRARELDLLAFARLCDVAAEGVRVCGGAAAGPDRDAWLADLCLFVDDLARHARRIGAGDGPAEVAPPFRDALVAMFVNGCRDALDLAAPGHGRDPSARELRETVHLLAREAAGVGLSSARELAVRALAAIDACGRDDRRVPPELGARVFAWFDACADRLAEDPSASPPDTADLVRELDEATDTLSGLGLAGAPEQIVLAVSPDWQEVVPDFVTEVRGHLATAEKLLLEIENGGASSSAIDAVFRAFHTVKGVASCMDLGPIVRVAHAAEAVLDGWRRGGTVAPADVHPLLAAADTLGVLVESLVGGQAPLVRDIDALMVLLHDNAGARGADERPASAVRVGAGPGPASPPADIREASVKVRTDRLDRLIELVGELATANAMAFEHPLVAHTEDAELSAIVARTGRLLTELRDGALGLRTVPLEALFHRMARVLRDVAVRAGKAVRVALAGEDTELDRRIVEALSDPLVHMIRNAVDHGIEDAASRRAAGKPAEGTVAIRARHEGGGIVVEVADDGAGIDRERVLQRARERGLAPIGADTAAWSDARVHDLIFMPGFSTADRVTDLSGRGVGMDVVRRNVEAVRGSIDIETSRGRGTRFVLRLPLTLASIDGLVVLARGERYIIPTVAVERCEASAGAPAVIGLRQVIGFQDGDEQWPVRVALCAEGRRAVLGVDHVVGRQQVVVRSLGLDGRAPPLVSGGAILGDGRVALILDPVRILARAEARAGGDA
jgi:two-component system chemotaxis sensor kinase CheA